MPGGKALSLRAVLAMLASALASMAMLASTSAVAANASVAEKKIENKGAGFEMSFAYPQIGIASADAEMEEWAQSLADAFKGWLAQRRERDPPYFAELAYDVARDDDDVVSIVFTYAAYAGGAHPNLAITTFNYLMPDGARVFLPEIVGADGIQRVSDIAIADLSTRLTGPNGMSDPKWIASGAGPYADEFDSFELLEDEIVLHFNPYTVAAYAAGPQEVHIPLASLQDVLRDDPRAPLPSFACAQARTAIERGICSDATLAQLDRRTAEAFAMRLRLEAVGAQAPTIRAQQRAWLMQRDAACAELADLALVACLKDEYAARLTALRSMAQD